MREMTDPEGGFYSSQDADSEGQEGKFFIWPASEIRDVLGKDADEFLLAYGVTERGNFEGQNILEFVGDMSGRAALAESRRRLFLCREKRAHPGRDDKVLTAWNGLMLAAFSEAARVFARDGSDDLAEAYRQVAEHNADFLLRELRGEDGRLYRSWRDGEAKINGYLEDYTHLMDGLLELYQTTFDPRWYTAASDLAESMIDRTYAVRYLAY